MQAINRKIHQIDAAGKSTGRLATEVARLLRGKNKPSFRPNLDDGDEVEIFGCEKMKFTGAKLKNKEYIWHSNYPGGLKRKKMKEVFDQNPAAVLRRAVLGMLPKNKLRSQMIKRLKFKK